MQEGSAQTAKRNGVCCGLTSQFLSCLFAAYLMCEGYLL